MTSINEYRAQFWVSDGLYNFVIEQSGMSSSEYMTLYCISHGINTQAAISKKLYMPKQTINSAVKKFETQGVLTMLCVQGNDKLKALALTKKGEQLVKDKVLAMDDVEDAVWNDLDESEREQLVSLTTKFNAILKQKFDQYYTNDNRED